MKAYIGAPGRLIALPYVSAQSMDPPQDYTFERTLEGRVKAQAKTTKRRTWSLSVDRYMSGAQGALMSFINGEWGRGPFVWVSVDAQVTNLLTPEQASCDPSALWTAGVVAAGPLDLGVDGWAGRSFMNPTPATPFYFGTQAAPVVPGQVVTASAYVVGAGSGVRIQWIDSAGSFISSSSSAGSGVAGVAKRIHVTALPPVNAAGAQFLATNATQGARPAMTWTSQVLEWADGQGCPKSVVHTATRELRMISPDPRGLRTADMSFTITEVG